MWKGGERSSRAHGIVAVSGIKSINIVYWNVKNSATPDKKNKTIRHWNKLKIDIETPTRDLPEW